MNKLGSLMNQAIQVMSSKHFVVCHLWKFIFPAAEASSWRQKLDRAVSHVFLKWIINQFIYKVNVFLDYLKCPEETFLFINNERFLQNILEQTRRNLKHDVSVTTCHP